MIAVVGETPRERFVQAVEAREWSYYALSKALTVRPDRVRGGSHGSIINYKNGKAEPSLEFLHVTADVLHISRRWLVEGEGEMDAELERLAQKHRSPTEDWDLIDQIAKGPGLLVLFRSAPVQALFIEALRRRLEIESAVRRIAEQPEAEHHKGPKSEGEVWDTIEREFDRLPEVENREILQWAWNLRDLVMRPWGLDVTGYESKDVSLTMPPHEFTAYATSVLTAVLGSMTESYRARRIKEAYEKRKEKG